MTRDLENATKAAQCAELLCGDLRELVKSENLLLSDVALAHLQTATRLRTDLERIAGLLKQMERP